MNSHTTFSLIGACFLLTGLTCACGGGVPDSNGEPQELQEAPVAKPPADPDDVWLAFDTVGGGGSEISVMRADGSRRRTLDLGMSARAPAFSPDGRELAFAGPGGIWIRDLTTGHSRQLTHGMDDVPTWSPDGTLIAFTRDVSIFIIGADGSNEHMYIEGPPPGQPWFSNYGHPVFAGDGMSLVFGRRGGIEMGALDGSNVHTLLDSNDSSILMATVSPDGTELALMTSMYPCSSVRIVPITIQGQLGCNVGRELVGTQPLVTRPAWSANGLIAFIKVLDSQISVVPAAGGTPTVILDTRQSMRGVNAVLESLP